jgi:hypothetical protein
VVGTNVIPDGNAEIAAEIPRIVDIIARTCRWVHPNTFHQLPVWCPDQRLARSLAAGERRVLLGAFNILASFQPPILRGLQPLPSQGQVPAGQRGAGDRTMGRRRRLSGTFSCHHFHFGGEAPRHGL